MSKEKKSEGKVISISGFVEELELEDGNAGLQIAAEDREFLIEMDKNGKKLLDYIDEEMEVTGSVTKKQGRYQIKVSQFRSLDAFDDDDDDSDMRYDDDDDNYYDKRSDR